MGARLGNQLFRYAFARALQIKFYPDYKLYIHVGAYNLTPSIPLREYENGLKYFRIQHAGFTEKRFRNFYSFPQMCIIAFRNRLLKKILTENFFKYIDSKILQRLCNRLGIYNPETVSEYLEPLKSKSRRIVCSANFENPRYFDEIRDVLLEEFTPIDDPLPENLPLLDRITNYESVCVHIRRGDFLAPENAAFKVCNQEYFVTAMKAIREEIPDCKFFIFSDDIDNVKQAMNLPFEAEYVSSQIPPYETLRLMYSCRHFIISNSTFSWWAQYLSRNDSKIVYAPTPWHWTGETWQDLYLPYMRTIECRKS